MRDGSRSIKSPEKAILWFAEMGVTRNICLLLCLWALCLCDDSLEDKEDPAFGGVSIKVFRGPSKVKGREVFAPFGYYVKMPADSSSSDHQKGEDEDDQETDSDQSFEFDSAEGKDSNDDQGADGDQGFGFDREEGKDNNDDDEDF